MKLNLKNYYIFKDWFWISRKLPVRVYEPCSLGYHRVSKKDAISLIQYMMNDKHTTKKERKRFLLMLKLIKR